MTSSQRQAIAALKRGMTMCHQSGLAGGVYECNFCVWPKEHDPHTGDFWQQVEEYGEVIHSPLHLDGGAGG